MWPRCSTCNQLRLIDDDNVTTQVMEMKHCKLAAELLVSLLFKSPGSNSAHPLLSYRVLESSAKLSHSPPYSLLVFLSLPLSLFVSFFNSLDVRSDGAPPGLYLC